MKDKIELLLDAIENPDFYSEEEIKQLLDDAEISEIYNIVTKSADAYTQTKEPDINKEWKDFVKKHKTDIKATNHKNFKGFISRNVAAIILCVVVSVVLVAGSFSVSKLLNHSTPPIDITETTTHILDKENIEDNDTIKSETSLNNESHTKVFKNVMFTDIISEIAEYYGKNVNYNNSKTKELRLYFQWDQTLPIEEIIEQLNNFEQIKVSILDNIITIY